MTDAPYATIHTPRPNLWDFTPDEPIEFDPRYGTEARQRRRLAREVRSVLIIGSVFLTAFSMVGGAMVLAVKLAFGLAGAG